MVDDVIASDVARETVGVGLVLSALFYGFRHGIDWDHIAAITDIAGSQDDRRSAMLFGTLYALGHALVVFVIGTVAIVLGGQLSPGLDAALERVVGVTLVLLGVYVLVGLVRHGREFRLRSRWMLIFSGGRNLFRRLRGPSPQIDVIHDRAQADAHDHARAPVHVHAADDAGGEPLALEVADDVPVSQWHHGHHGHPGHHHHKHPEPDEPFMNYGRATSFVVGMIHGVGAETPTQILVFVAAAGAGGTVAGEAVLVAFILGLLSSNSLIVFGSSIGFLRAAGNWKVYVTVALFTAAFSLVIGMLFIFGEGALLPEFFSG